MPPTRSVGDLKATRERRGTLWKNRPAGRREARLRESDQVELKRRESCGAVSGADNIETDLRECGPSMLVAVEVIADQLDHDLVCELASTVSLRMVR